MSGLELLAPAGLIALLSVPLVILFHMRHTEPVVRPVPTLRFWLAALEQRTETSRFRRPPLTLLLLLHLVIVVAIALALARPVTSRAWGGIATRTEPKHVILLLDGSTSMAATDTPSGRSRFEEARDLALTRFSELREGDVATLVLLGTHPLTFEATDAASIRALRDALRSLPPPGGRADLNAALRLANDLLLPDLADQIVLISDGALVADPSVVANLGAPIELVRVGRLTTANLAITDLSARASPDAPDRYQVYARIVNFGDESQTVRIVFLADGIEFESRTEAIAPESDAEIVAADVPEGASRITVTASTRDALLADNTASLVLPQKASLGLRILLVSDTAGYVRRALTALPGAHVTVQSTADHLSADPADLNADLIVYEGFTPPTGSLPHRPVLFVNPPRDGLFPVSGTMTSPVIDRLRAHDPLLAGVDLTGVTFGETAIHQLDGTATEVVGGTDRDRGTRGPLLYRGTAPETGEPMIVLPFDPNDERSNLAQRVAFPILMANIVDELAPSALPASLPLGEPLRYRPRSAAATVRITPPDGKSVDLPVAHDPGTDAGSLAQPLRDVVFPDTGRPGDYQIAELDAGGNVIGGGTFVINAGHARESDLRANLDLPGILATAHATADSGSRLGLADLWPTLVTAALIILGLEWLWAIRPARARRRIPTTHPSHA
ncbi:MAG: lipoprotein [Thermomicrobiales bacterium]|nr:MAG: lipoprotein [Thermomicrobiales bacterium]